MEKSPRKATDIILDLESKIDILINLVRSQDLNIKVLSNKLNTVIDRMDSFSSQSIPKIEAVDFKVANNIESNTEKIIVSSESTLQVDNNPQGFRRTSRPETFSGDNMYLSRQETNHKVEDPTPVVSVNQNPVTPKKEESVDINTKNSIPTVQRIVDKNGKSIFLADVEIFNDKSESIFKTRTNGTGKWMATLPVGSYKVVVKKRESMTKEKLESTQKIVVDGSQSPLELPMIIIK